MATRRNTKTQARRSGGNNRSGGGTSPVTVFVVGAALGAAVLFGAPRLLKEDGADGFLRPKPNAEAEPANLAVEQRVADGDGVVAKPSGAKPEVAAEPVTQGTEFDFYNVLPNKEVDMTPEQQAALNAAEARRRAQAAAAEERRAQAAAVTAQSAQSQSDAGVQVMPDMNLPKPVTPAAAPKPTASTPAPVAAPAARQPEAPKALPKPVAAAPASTTAPVAAVRDRPVKTAAATAAEAPKPRAKAVAAYAANPDVTAGSRNMVMPAASLDPTRTFEKPTAAPKTAASASSPSSKVVVQAGAYSDKDQAEKVKAKIAMLGLGARVESSTSDGKSVYRVRLGPYAENSSDLANAKRALSGGGLGAMEVRL